MIFGKTPNHKLVFPKDNKKAKQPAQSQVQKKDAPPAEAKEVKPLTASEEITANNSKIYKDAAKEM